VTQGDRRLCCLHYLVCSIIAATYATATAPNCVFISSAQPADFTAHTAATDQPRSMHCPPLPS
jgi:hypothetical protein